MAMLDDKRTPMAHDEDVETGRPIVEIVDKKHADRALAIVGTGRVDLTEEDVSSTFNLYQDEALLLIMSPEQTNQKENRSCDTCRSGLDLFPSNP
jgi:hypothetical protein